MTTYIEQARTHRDRALRRSLETGRRRILRETRKRMREAKALCIAEAGAVPDLADVSMAETQEEVDFALIEMQSETLGRMTEAIERLDAGDYGYCVDCASEIAARRLEALPFATRCRSCEEAHEQQSQRMSPPDGRLTPFAKKRAYAGGGSRAA